MIKLTLRAAVLIVVTAALASCANSSTPTSASAVSPSTPIANGPASGAAVSLPPPSGSSMPAVSAAAQPQPAQSSSVAPTASVPSTSPDATPTAVPAVGAHAVATIGATVVTCPDPATADGSDSGATRPLAAGVVVSAVVRCETVTRTYPGDGTFTVQLAEVADTGLADFVAGLRQPSDPRGTNVVCPMLRIATPWFALIDNHGNVLRVALPTTQCGQVRATTLAALNALPFRDVAAVRIARVPAAG